MKRLLGVDPDDRRIIYGFSNAFKQKWRNAADTKQKWRNAADTLDITALQVDSDERLLLRDEAVDPNWTSITFNLETSASLVDQVFFIMPFAGRVEKIEAVHKTANGAAMTATIKKMADGVTLANGTAVMTSTFDMNATADTLQQATVSTARGVADLAGRSPDHPHAEPWREGRHRRIQHERQRRLSGCRAELSHRQPTNAS
jgi:hypothetical protein